MAAWLAEIKSRLLLPRPPRSDADGEPEDPRADLAELYLLHDEVQSTQKALEHSGIALNEPTGQAYKIGRAHV